MFKSLRMVRALFALVFLSAISAVATPQICPMAGGANPHYPALGATYEDCGTVTYGPTEIVTAVPNGSPYSDVASWLGLVNGISDSYASAILFPDFHISGPSKITFDWQGEVEPGASGYVFAAIDSSIAWQYTFGGNATGSRILAIGPGSHSLAFGTVATGVECLNCSIVFDPILTITNLGVQAIPEPSTVALIGLGLGSIAFFRRRRRG